MMPHGCRQLRRRLAVTFGVETDPETSGRDEVMSLLLERYALEPARVVRNVQGRPLGPDIAARLLAALRATKWERMYS